MISKPGIQEDLQGREDLGDPSWASPGPSPDQQPRDLLVDDFLCQFCLAKPQIVSCYVFAILL